MIKLYNLLFEATEIDNIDEISSMLKKYNYDIGNALGSGTQGVAYTLSNDSTKVLKITKDDREANTCSSIIGKDLKYVYKIYRVFQLKNIKDYYFIVMENLDKLNEASDIENYLRQIKIYDRIRSDDFKTEYVNDNKKYLSDEYIKNIKDTNVIQFVKKYNIDFLSVFTLPAYIYGTTNRSQQYDIILNNSLKLSDKHIQYIFQLYSGLVELGDLGITFGDVQDGNIMKRGNSLVIVDLGKSKSKEMGRIELLEKRKLMNEILTPKNLQYFISELSKASYDGKSLDVESGGYHTIDKKQGKDYICFLKNFDDKIIRITSDHQKIQIANRLITRTYKHIVNVYNVVSFEKDNSVKALLVDRNKMISNPNELLGMQPIGMEYLSTLKKETEFFISEVLDNTNLHLTGKLQKLYNSITESDLQNVLIYTLGNPGLIILRKINRKYIDMREFKSDVAYNKTPKYYDDANVGFADVPLASKVGKLDLKYFKEIKNDIEEINNRLANIDEKFITNTINPIIFGIYELNQMGFTGNIFPRHIRKLINNNIVVSSFESL